MRTFLSAALALCLLSPHAALASEGHAPHAHAPATPAAMDAAFEGSVVVEGSPRALRAALIRPERWPQLFSDTRSVSRGRAGVWSIDFKGFGHAHDFTVKRTETGVVLELADKSHGAARFEYVLKQLAPGRTTFSVRLAMATPPQLTRQKALELLRAKVATDLADFARAASGL